MFKKKKKENRNFARADFYQASYFKVEDEGKDAPINECWFNNISLGGVAIEADKNRLEKDKKIKVLYKIGTIYRNDLLSIRFGRKLMSRFRFGCQFVDEDDARDNLIKKYIEEKLEKES